MGLKLRHTSTDWSQAIQQQRVRKRFDHQQSGTIKNTFEPKAPVTATPQN